MCVCVCMQHMCMCLLEVVCVSEKRKQSLCFFLFYAHQHHHPVFSHYRAAVVFHKHMHTSNSPFNKNIYCVQKEEEKN